LAHARGGLSRIAWHREGVTVGNGPSEQIHIGLPVEFMAARGKKHPSIHQLKRWGLAATLLGTLMCTKAILFRIPMQAEAYHRRIESLALASPSHFGSWVSLEVPVPEAAVTMLRPNATISRKYTNIATGEDATLLLIQCKDARDLFGHYPPVCYAAHGFKLIESTARDWRIDDLTIQGMAYGFSSTRPNELTSMFIYDFMILPNGQTCRGMEGVYASARDPQRRRLGAAQMQVLFNSTMPQERRDALFMSLVASNRPTIDAILAGGTLP
jgi:hypothetical protein